MDGSKVKKHMMNMKGNVLQVMLASLVHCISCQPALPTFTASPIISTSSCGLQIDSNDYWTLNGTMDIPDKSDFSSEIIIKARVTVCIIHLTNCPPLSTPSTGNACYCTEVNAKQDSYKLVVRQQARKWNRNAPLIAWYISSNVFENHIVKYQNIGTLPVMFGPVTSSVRILGCHGTEACKGQPMEIDPITYVAENTRVKVHLCVRNLLGGLLTISINDSQIFVSNETSDMVCGKIGLKTRSEGKAVLLSLTYREYNGCKRSGNYTVNLVAVSTDNLDYVENTSARKTCPNNGVTLAVLIVVIMVVT